MIKIPFHIPNIPGSIEKIFSQSVKSGWLTTGSQVDRLERKIAAYI